MPSFRLASTMLATLALVLTTSDATVGNKNEVGVDSSLGSSGEEGWVQSGSSSDGVEVLRSGAGMSTKVAVGDEAPDFTLVDSGFGTVTLSELRGQKVVLTFFPAAFSGAPDDGCEMHLCSLKQVENAAVLGVSVDLPFAQAAFASKIELPYKLLSDPSGKLAESYVDLFDIGSFLSGVGVAPEEFNGVMSYPRALFVIDEEGIVTYTWIGEEDGNPHPGMQPPVSEVLANLGQEGGAEEYAEPEAEAETYGEETYAEPEAETYAAEEAAETYGEETYAEPEAETYAEETYAEAAEEAAEYAEETY